MSAPLTCDCVQAYSQVMTTTAKTTVPTLDDLRQAGTAYLRHRDKAEASRVVLHDLIQAVAGTTSELQIAKATGVTRQTVRKALGK